MRKIIIYTSFLIVLTLSGMDIFAQQYSVCESGANYVEMQQTCNNVPGEYEAREKISLMPNFRFNKNDGGNQVFSIKLNETLVLDLESTPEINVPDIENIEIDASLAVGSIAGMYGVSGTGAATYTVPIGVPKGVAGLEPNISINYNSQSGNGLLGWGWHLAGTSSVVRVPQNEYYDDNITAIQLTNEDRFMLDGVRLLPKNSSNYTGYGANDFLYEKEVTDFSTIKSILNTNGPQSFIVTTKDGIIIEYGVTADSRLLTSGNKILAWNINKITDRNGNYIKFTYDNSNQECVISHIEYTGNINAGQEPTNKITFVYDKRSVDKNLMYISDGQYIKSEKILTKIIVRSNNSVLTKYEFEYFNDDVFTKLYKIRQFGINDEEINSTFVNWGEKGDLFTIGTPTSLPITNKDERFWLSGNFTGTGFPDIITIDFDLINNMYYHTDLTLFYTNSCDINANYYSVEYNIGDDYIAVPLPKRSLIYNTSDFTGDLRDDILLTQVIDRIGYNQYGIGAFKIISVVGNPTESYSFVELHKELPHTDEYYYKLNLAGRNVFLGDYTGDGKTNIICFLERDTLVEVFGQMMPLTLNEPDAYIFTPSGNELFQFREESLYLFNDLCDINNEVRCYDFTGDGKQEIMIKYSDQIKVYKVIIVEGKAEFVELLVHNYSENSQSIMTYGDFNGDGKTDILVEEAGFPEYNLFIDYNTGNEFNRVDIDIDYTQYIIESLNENKDHVFHAFDFNADGKTDILVLRKELIPGTIINDLYKYKYIFDIYYSTGNNQFYLKQFGPTTHFTEDLFFGDYTGDGSIDIFLQSVLSYPDDYPAPLDGQPIHHKVFAFNYNDNSRFVVNILNGLGSKTQFEYNYINKTTNFSSYLPNLMPDNINSVILPIPVVTKTKIDNAFDENSFTVTDYSYTGSLFDRNKRNWIGFYKTSNQVMLVNAANIFTTTENKIIHDGILVPHKITEGNLGTPQAHISEFEYEILTPNTLNSKIIFPYQNQIIEKQYTGPSYTSSTTINNINNLGNLYYSKTTTENNIDDNKIIVETDYVYVGAGDITTPHKPEFISTKTSYQNFNETVPEDDFETEVHYEYYPNGNLKKQTDNKTNIYTLYEDYNHFGLPKKITSIVPEKTPRTKNFVYSQCGRFVLKETDDMDLSIEYIYHPSTNNLVSTTDIYGHITSFKYDNLNRLIETTNPFGIKSKRTYEWALNSDIDNAVYKITTNAPNQPEQISYFDKLSRNIRNESKGYQNRTILATNEFDRLGNIIKKSEPYYSNESPFFIEYEYYTEGYFFNKLHKIMSRNQTTVYEYAHNSKTITAPSGIAYTENFDIAGNVTNSFFPHNNSVSFVYGSHGNPIEIVANGVSSLMNYNELIQQESLTDANAGTIEYDYFADGMLKDQSDARGMEIALQYDQFDRIEKMILDSGDGEIEYDYYTDGNAKAMLKSISAPVNETQYEYDSYQRLVKLSENIDNTVYEFEYIYDNKGNLIKEIYPNNFGIIYEYDNNGLLTGVKELTTNQDIWSTTDYNALGQVGDIYLRNNNRIKYTYDSQTGLLNNIAFGDQTQSFGISYNFNAATGNLDSRTCTKHNIAENFTYDNLNRLRTYTVEQNSNIEEFEVNYYDNGNISEKSDVGQYIYDDTDQPHAVKVILPFEMEGGQYEHNPLLDQDIQYNSYNKATKITQGDYELEIFYGHDKERRKTILKEGENTVYTRYYLGNYEKEITSEGTTEYYYVGGPMGNVAVFISENGAAPELYYTITDHLGSIVAIADEDGEIIEEQRYDPWGNYRNPLTGEPEETPQHTMLYRGYTGHEMLPEFGLINMNGRLYDPVIARVLSPDNNVQNPYNPQNYNRYSYCYNNPLSYTDPDGEWLHLVVGGVIGGTMNLIMNANNIDNFWQELGYFGIGAVTGVLSAGVGVGIQTASAGASFWAGFVGSSQGISTILSVGYTSSFLTGAATGIGSGFVGGFGSGFGNSLAGGNKFADSFKTGLKQGLYGGAIGGLSGGIAGGIDAYRNGRDFFNGGPTLETKLEILLEKNCFSLNYEIGEAGVSDVYLANRKNLSSLEGYRNSFGDILQPNGKPANGFCNNGRGFDITYDGYVRFTDNEIYLSKNTVRRMWRGSMSARETLFHEWFHARDYYTGTADFFFQQYKHDWIKTSNMLEFRAHSFNYSRLQNFDRLIYMEHYSRLFFGFPGLY